MQANIARVASLMGDNTRSLMLNALLSGKALTATELATCADVSAQTASAHLAKLLEGNLIRVRKQGRHKYFQLAGPQVADVLEQLLNLSVNLNNTPENQAKIKPTNIVTGPDDIRLRHSRICYDHLAGELAVNLYDALIQNKWLIEENLNLQLSESGKLAFASFGFELDKASLSKRPLCRTCLDWSERRTHLAGALGSWILTDSLAKKWAKQDMDSRVIQFNTAGLKRFKQRYAL